MIFLGDFVYPFTEKKCLHNFSKEFINEYKFLNLEGAIVNENHHQKLTKGIAIRSSEYALKLLSSLNVKGVGLANNHIFDYKIEIDDQIEKLEKNEILACGAGINLEEALKPILLEDNKYKYAIYSFGWNVIGCRYANSKQAGVAALDEFTICETIRKARTEFSDRKIILFVHWNYEFEYYPQPADRKLSFKAIEAGADAIIGHHPHIVGVYEEYKNKPIVYSLGNFFMPEAMGFGDRSKLGLGFKYDKDITKIKLYWIENSIDYLRISSEENLTKSSKLVNITSKYQDNLKDYGIWFQKHRRKKILLPVYYDHNRSFQNKLLFKLLMVRNILVHNLTQSGIRTRNN